MIKNKAAQELGARGGMATKIKKGAKFFKEISKKGVEARRAKAEAVKVINR